MDELTIVLRLREELIVDYYILFLDVRIFCLYYFVIKLTLSNNCYLLSFCIRNCCLTIPIFLAVSGSK